MGPYRYEFIMLTTAPMRHQAEKLLNLIGQNMLINYRYHQL